MKAKNAGSEDACDFAETLVGGHGGGIVVWSHGTSGWVGAPTATFALRRAGCLAGRVRLPMTFARGTGPVNSTVAGKRRFREFYPDILACERNLDGPSRSQMALCQTRERGASGGINGSACRISEKREKSVISPPGVSW